MSGYQNKATLAKVERDIWAKCENNPDANLVLFVKGYWWIKSINSEPGSVKYLESGAIVRFEAEGTAIQPGLIQMSPNTELAVCNEGMRPNAMGLLNCDSPDWFVGSLDYEGSIYSFVGKIKLLGWTFESAPDAPLVFSLHKSKGLIYVSGKGTVYGKDGTKTVLGVDKEKQRMGVSF